MIRRKFKPRTKFWIYPYGWSHSAHNLVEELDGRLIKREGSKYQHRVGDVVINWGCATIPGFLAGVHLVNAPDAVRVATSKTGTYEALAAAGVQTVSYTRDRAQAQDWGRRGRIVARTLDHGSQGRGITVYEKEADLGQAAFYCKYIRKQREFRIHVFRGEVIFEQEKLRKRGHPDVDPYIRSHGRGWCFGFSHLQDNPVPDGVRAAAQKGVLALGLDFGAVDMAWSERRGGTVLEVNTAPGIEKSSLAAYVNAIRRLIRGEKK